MALPTLADLKAFFADAPAEIRNLFYALTLLALSSLAWLMISHYYALWPFTAGEVKISVYQKVQYDMTMKHLSENPAKEYILEDDAEGATKVRLYGSDKALLVVRAAPGARTSVTWMQKPKPELEVAESYFNGRKFINIYEPGYSITDHSDPAYGTEDLVTLADAAFAEPVPAGCIPLAQHGAPSGQKEDPPRVWLSWPDGCYGFLIRNPDGSIAADQNGQPLFTWAHCVH